MPRVAKPLPQTGASSSITPGTPDRTDPELGPLLFERSRPSYLFMVPGGALAITAAVLLCTALGGMITNAGTAAASGPDVLTWVGTILLATAAGVLIFFAYRFKVILRFHQSGVARRLKGESGPVDRLPYHAIAGIGFAAVRHHTHGIYSHTSLAITIRPDASLGLTDFVYRGRLKEKRRGLLKVESVDELEPIHVAVSERLASLMFDRIRAGEVVPWTDKLGLSRDGLHVRGSVIPYDQIKDAQITQGRMAVKVQGKFFAAATAQAGEMNFLPGWLVFTALLGTQR